MAVLADSDRQDAWARLMRDVPRGTVFTISKAELRACVNAADSVLSSNAATLNTAIQALEPTWNTLPQATRAFIFAFVVHERFGKGV